MQNSSSRVEEAAAFNKGKKALIERDLNDIWQII